MRTIIDKKKVFLLDREYEVRLYEIVECNKRVQLKPALVRVPCKKCGK